MYCAVRHLNVYISSTKYRIFSLACPMDAENASNVLTLRALQRQFRFCACHSDKCSARQLIATHWTPVHYVRGESWSRIIIILCIHTGKLCLQATARILNIFSCHCTNLPFKTCAHPFAVLKYIQQKLHWNVWGQSASMRHLFYCTFDGQLCAFSTANLLIFPHFSLYFSLFDFKAC